MQKIINFKKSKLIVVLGFVVFSITCILVMKKHNSIEVESYSISENYNSASVELKTLERDRSFKFLFADAVKSPFSLNVTLDQSRARGLRSLWLYAGQANDHGQLIVKNKGELIGVVNNQLAIKVVAPLPKLSYVGEIRIDESEVNLEITGFNKTLDRHYSELGLIVLAPQGMKEEKVLNILTNKSETSATDAGLLVVILFVAYSVLVILSRENNLKDEKTWVSDILAAFVLVTICFITYFSNTGFTTPPLSNAYVSERTGIERLIDSGLKDASSELKQAVRSFLPNRQQNDEILGRLQLSSGTFETSTYRINQTANFNKVSSGIFSGKMAEIQRMKVEQFGRIVLWASLLILITLMIDRLLSRWWSASITLGLISSLSILISIRLSEGWDEFFINLRHAYMLVNNGVYSINTRSLVEASVDFLPLLATAFLGWLKIELVDAFIIISLLGNVGVVIFSYLLVLKINQDRTWALISALIVGLYPNVVWVGASGFSAVLFCGWMLAAIYFSLFSERRVIGLVLLSTLTLVRTEGILFAALLMGYIYILKPLPNIVQTRIWRPAVRRALAHGAIVLLPFVSTLIIRKIFFGHAIPNPVSFKNTNFDSSFFANGIDRFVQMISSHDLHLIILIIIILAYSNFAARGKDIKLKEWGIEVQELIVVNVLIFIFILPYYIGGGDWFSVKWNRYGLPFNIITLLTLMILLYGAFFMALKRWVSWAGLIIFSFAFIIGYQKSAQFRQDNFIFSTLPSVIKPYDGRWQRVDNLASLGQFLDDVLPADAVVSSPEEATIMYFSKREMLGLLGVSNPDMTTMPFQPMHPGDILHRRRGYASVYKSRPDVIALYEPVALGDYGSNSSLDAKIKHTLQTQFFNNDMVNISYYRVGSFAALEKMGYRHFSISYPDRVFSIFVGERIYDDFLKNMKAKGFEYFGSNSIYYYVNPELSKKYVPSTKEIMAEL